MNLISLNSNLGEVKVTDNVYNSIAAGGATSIYGKTIEATKGTDTYYLTANAEKELLVGFRSTPAAAITWKKYVANTDLHNPYKTYLLTWGNYSDGTYTLLESIIGRGISITAGTNGRLRGTWIPSSINDLRSIVIPGGGVIDVKILSATQVQITGTTSEYRIRDISAI